MGEEVFAGPYGILSQLQAFSSVPERLINLHLMWLDPTVSFNEGHQDNLKLALFVMS